MSSLNELIHYCNEADPLGALLLTGEWGCGKTYLIEKELSEALKDTHIIVRVSLFGISSASMLRDTVRRSWFEACLPLIGALRKAREGGLFTAVNNALSWFNPLAGGAANIVVSANMQDFIPIKPEVDDLRSNSRKKVVLVYDDLERAKIDFEQVLGVINDFCENHNFNSIVSVNEEAIKPDLEEDLETYEMLREKTISQVLYHVPDYDKVIHAIINRTNWPSEEYKEYLLSNEDMIRHAFISDEEAIDTTSLIQKNRKNHNFRTLAKGLQSFYRIFFDINEIGKEVKSIHLYSFLAYYLIANSGIIRDGKPNLTFEEKDLLKYYPHYSSESMTDAERSWINTGIWNKEGFLKEISDKG